MEGLRQELRAAEAQIDEMKASHAGWVRCVCVCDMKMDGRMGVCVCAPLSAPPSLEHTHTNTTQMTRPPP